MDSSYENSEISHNNSHLSTDKMYDNVYSKKPTNNKRSIFDSNKSIDPSIFINKYGESAFVKQLAYGIKNQQDKKVRKALEKLDPKLKDRLSIQLLDFLEKDDPPKKKLIRKNNKNNNTNNNNNNNHNNNNNNNPKNNIFNKNNNGGDNTHEGLNNSDLLQKMIDYKSQLYFRSGAEQIFFDKVFDIYNEIKSTIENKNFSDLHNLFVVRKDKIPILKQKLEQLKNSPVNRDFPYKEEVIAFIQFAFNLLSYLNHINSNIVESTKVDSEDLISDDD